MWDGSGAIHPCQCLATFGPRPFWLLMFFLPRYRLTKMFMRGLDVVLFFALLQ
jgi:hypothetical protein